MSNALAIATVTAVLQDILHTALINAPSDESVSGAEVITAVPTADVNVISAGPKINVYLYQVTPSAALRNADLPTRPGAVALDLHYLLSFYGSEATLEPQRLLGLAVRALASHAIVARSAIDTFLRNLPATDSRLFLKGSNLSKAADLIKVSPTALSLEEMSRVWSVFFQTRYTLSLAYQCSVVIIDSEIPPRPALPVLERRIELDPFVSPPAAPIAPVAPVIRALTRTVPAPGTTLLAVTFDPEVAPSQRTTLVLREDRDGALPQLFGAPERADPLTAITFTSTRVVPAGTYIAHLIVDRAESPPFRVVLP